jgi:arylsulfatase A-like enzyme
VNAFVVLKRLLAQPADENFAALHWILDPHHPYEPVEEFRARIKFDADALSRPPDYYEDGVIDPEWTTPADDEYLESLYLAEVESVDERVGFLIEMLRFRGFLENTVIVFTSDHGEEFGNHGLYGHGGFGRHLHFYEGLLRVPLIIVAPGLSAGSRVTEPVTLLDLMPTLEDLLGIRYEGEMGGVSRTPLLRGEPMASAPLYFDDVQEDDQTDALRDGRFKIICRRDGRHELYDLVADPGETEDLSSKRPEKLAEMFSLVERFRQENSRRGVRKAAEVDPSLQHLSEEERARAMEQLRSLGYIE